MITTASIKEIITNSLVLDDALLSALLKADIVERSQRIMLFTMALPNLNEESCQKHFAELGLSELNGIFVKNGGRRNYENSSETTTVFNSLKLNHWIYDYKEDERNPERYIVIKNRPREKEPAPLD